MRRCAMDPSSLRRHSRNRSCSPSKQVHRRIRISASQASTQASTIRATGMGSSRIRMSVCRRERPISSQLRRQHPPNKASASSCTIGLTGRIRVATMRHEQTRMGATSPAQEVPSRRGRQWSRAEKRTSGPRRRKALSRTSTILRSMWSETVRSQLRGEMTVRGRSEIISLHRVRSLVQLKAPHNLACNRSRTSNAPLQCNSHSIRNRPSSKAVRLPDPSNLTKRISGRRATSSARSNSSPESPSIRA